MTFVDDLNSGKFDQRVPRITEELLNAMVEDYVRSIRQNVIAQSGAGRRSLKGHLAYSGYDNDYCRLNTDEKITCPIGLEGLGVPIETLRERLSARLQEDGFRKATVKSVTVPIYKREAAYFFAEWKYKVVGHERTVYIELSW